MLQKFIFKMKCKEPGAVRGFGGVESHAMLFNLLKNISPMEAEQLHDCVEKPFAMSAINGEWQREKEYSISKLGYIYTLTVSSLTEGMRDLLEKTAEQYTGKEIMIGTGIFTIEAITKKYKKPITYSQITASPPLDGDITLQFCTPTSFRRHGIQILLPQPERIYESLLHKWNTFSPLKLDESLDFSCINIKKYNLRTKMVHFKNYMVAGFVGRCTFHISRNCNDYHLFHIHCLSRFAEFSGVGYKATMGLGNVKLLARDK